MRYYGYGDPFMIKLVVVAACVSVAVIVLLFTVIMPPAQLANNLHGSTPKPTLINTNDSAISPGALMYMYSLNSSTASKEYSGKLAYFNGIVANVEQGPNGYESCVALDSIGGYLVSGCAQAGASGGWIIWNWNDQMPVSSVPIGSNFIAECTIGGVTSGNLLLDSCSIVP